MVLDPARASLFGIAADLAYHDHRVRLGFVVEELHHVDMLQSVHRVAANAHARRLPETLLHQLSNRFVGQGAGARHHANAALLVNVAGHDADLDLVGRNDAGTVGTDENRLLALHLLARANHVAHGHALGDANDEIELGVDRLVDRRGGERWRHIDDRHRRAGPLFGFLHGAKDRYAFELLPGLLRIDAGNVALAAMGIVARHAGMKLAGLTGDALGDDLAVLADENTHDVSLLVGDGGNDFLRRCLRLVDTETRHAARRGYAVFAQDLLAPIFVNIHE